MKELGIFFLTCVSYVDKFYVTNETFQIAHLQSKHILHFILQKKIIIAEKIQVQLCGSLIFEIIFQVYDTHTIVMLCRVQGKFPKTALKLH